MHGESLSRIDTNLARWTTRASVAFSVLVWLAIAACLAAIFFGQYQWDMRVFHAAPLALDMKIDPYGMPSSIPGIPFGFCYLYPPVLLYVFKPLGAVSLETAMAIWFGLKMLAAAFLLGVWHRNFERLSLAWPTVLFLVLGFNSTILLDVAAGNIALFESLALWGAFALVLKGRPYLAGLIIAILSQFKLTPALFLGVLPFVGPARGWKPLFASGAVFTGLLALNPLLLPEMTSQFIDSFSSGNPNLDEHGQINPSTLSFFRIIVEFAAMNGVPLPRLLADFAYLLIAVSLLVFAIWLERRHSDRLRKVDQRWLIYLACVLYALAAPRMKDYSYVLLLIPALHVVRQAGVQAALPLVGLMALLPAHSTYLPGVDLVFTQLHSYLPWFTTWVLLYYLVREILQGEGRPDSQPIVVR